MVLYSPSFRHPSGDALQRKLALRLALRQPTRRLYHFFETTDFSA